MKDLTKRKGELIMKKLWYIPAEPVCECCKKPFREGDLLGRSAADGKTICAECRKDRSGKNCGRIDTYVFADGRACLVADKLTVRGMPDGSYQLGEFGDIVFYFMSAISTEAEADRMEYGTYFLKKKNGTTGVAIKGRCPEPDALFTAERVGKRIDGLCAVMGGEPYLLVSEENAMKTERVVGAVNRPLEDIDAGFRFDDIPFPIGRCNLCRKEQLQNEFEERHYDKKLTRILEELTARDMLEYVESRIIGQEQALKRAVYLVYHYLRSIAAGKPFAADNWMITAPSGAGKTEFYRAIRDLFALFGIDIPVVQIDLSQITESGYKGSNCDTIINRLAAVNGKLGGYAICFLDEADKKFRPSYGSNGVNINAAVQSNLLTMIEGTQYSVEIDDSTVDFDSGRTMFVFMGAFQELRDEKQKKKLARGMGFGGEVGKTDITDNADDSFYGEIDQQDMIEFGMLEEIAGRIVRVINFGALSEEDMAVLVRQKAELIGGEYGCKLNITDEAVTEIAGIAYGNTGIRKPINLIKQLVQDALMEAEFGDGFDAAADSVQIVTANKAIICKRGSKPGKPRRGDGRKTVPA